MINPTERVKYKAQVYDAALNAFFKLRGFDAKALGLEPSEVGWDIAEALVAAAVSGVTYKSANRERRFEAAQLLRTLADQVEEDGLAGVEWGYKGRLDARHAWRPDIRSAEGLAELDERTDAIIESMMAPLRALTVPDRRAIVCLSFVRMALAHVGDLVVQTQDGTPVRETVLAVLRAHLDNAAADGSIAAMANGPDDPNLRPAG
ncbi:hypothetical protein [Caulobacter sp. Root343]|jgi:hypothetical protein|uniref:hypothetical protein n=1 Tax=Caulobacter sp. Root343 TaxID=1736520 RepID=UPI0006FE3F63|nr:hypothetical protein [Caulobacter sp. Root343]KQV64073.1 hypothetical protein ASC70_19820 [Caulobacter sp. Root343]